MGIVLRHIGCLLLWFFCLQVHSLDAIHQPQQRALFPCDEKMSPHKARVLFDSLSQLKSDVHFYESNSHHHWLVYSWKSLSEKKALIVEVPDYQINEVEIFLTKKGSSSFKRIMRHGDELNTRDWTHPNRAAHALVEFEPGISYELYVYYSRPGNRPQFSMKFYEPQNYFIKWSRIERSFGFLYGLIFIYLVLVLVLTVYSRNKQFFYLSIWVLVYLGYFFISSGHFKYLFDVYIPNLFSTIRVSLIFFGLYAMHAFSLIHYQQEKKLWFVSFFWNMFLLLLFLLNGYNYLTGDNIYEGHEIEFIWLVRFLVMVLMLTQIYLPYQHYKTHRKITFFTYLLAFSGLNFFVYIYQTVVLEDVDFNRYIFTTIWFLIIEIVMIALGVSIFSLNERKKRAQIDATHTQLQQQSRILQFQVQEKERKRIAAELHDDITNRLSVSLLLYRDRYLSPSNFIENLHQISEDIKQYSLGIYPIWVEKRNIIDLIEENVKPLPQSRGIKFNVDVALDRIVELNMVFKLHLFRLIQEFVKNSVNHGNPERIEVKLFQNEMALNLHMQDDGIGYDLNKTALGLGSDSVKNRIQVLGGAISILSEPGKGVRWVIQIPRN